MTASVRDNDQQGEFEARVVDVAQTVGVQTVFGRSGPDVVAQSGDYTPEQVGAEPALGNPDTDDYVLSSKTDGTRSWVPGGGGGDDTYIGGLWYANSLRSGDVAINSIHISPNKFQIGNMINTVLIGAGAGGSYDSGSDYNTCIGFNSGSASVAQDYCTWLGYEAGRNAGNSMSYAVGLGAGAGQNSTNSNDCIFIGKNAGQANANPSWMYISSGNPGHVPFLKGDMAAGTLFLKDQRIHPTGIQTVNGGATPSFDCVAYSGFLFNPDQNANITLANLNTVPGKTITVTVPFPASNYQLNFIGPSLAWQVGIGPVGPLNSDYLYKFTFYYDGSDTYAKFTEHE